MIVCAGNNETFKFATPVGVGLIDSAINLTRLCLFDKPDFLLFVGSAGSYGKHHIFDILESKTATNIELGYFQKLSYTPIDNIVDEDVSRGTSDKIIVNCSNYITTNIENANTFLNAGISLENMEFYSVLKVAKEFNIPAAGVFIVTNYCNANAHDDFIKNHKKSKELLIKFIKEKYKDLKHD